MENRVLNRLRKRFTVRYGQEVTDKLAFTEDVSPTGLFIKTAQTIRPGTRVKVACELDHQTTVQLEGTVVWAKKVPANLIRVARKCGMGIHITRFIKGEEAYRGLFP